MESVQSIKTDDLSGLIDKIDSLNLDVNIQKDFQQTIQPVEFIDLLVDDKKQEKKKFTEPDLIKLLYYSLHLKQSDIFGLLTHLGIKHYQTKEVDITTELFPKYSEQIGKFNQDDYFVILSEQIYLLNSEFHITMFYNGGKKLTKPDGNKKTNFDKCAEFDNILGLDINVKVDQLSISSNFITIRIKELVAPYYGNPIKHITVGVSKMQDTKLKPVDSPSAFDINGVNEHIEIKADDQFSVLIGHLGKVTK
jgi:hypothetical protein